MKQIEFAEMAEKYCARQVNTVDKLTAILLGQIETYNSEGFMLLECEMMDSSRMGDLTILGFGGTHTHKVIPQNPVSPRGLASDMSVVIGWCSSDSVKQAAKRK